MKRIFDLLIVSIRIDTKNIVEIAHVSSLHATSEAVRKVPRLSWSRCGAPPDGQSGARLLLRGPPLLAAMVFAVKVRGVVSKSVQSHVAALPVHD
jgi:hypothetical protein